MSKLSPTEVRVLSIFRVFGFRAFGLRVFGLLGAIGWAAFGPVAAAAATGPADGPHVAASLVAETSSIAPGSKITLALRQVIEPGWHTYWINPGDSGLPTTIDWSLPPGFAAGQLAWPTPERIAYGPLVSYGYERELLLPVAIEAPATLVPGTNAVIKAHASWLACADICVPEESDLVLTLPVQAGPAAPDPRWAEAFAATRAAIPAANPFPAAIRTEAKTVALSLATGDASKLDDIAFFPDQPGVIDNEAPQKIETGAGGLTLILARGELKAQPLTRLSGVLAFRDRSTGGDGTRRAIAISVASDAAPLPAATVSAPRVATGPGFAMALLLAVAGGLVLNLMPCVLPVLSLKALALARHAEAAPRTVRLQGLAYAAGVLASFGLVAGALILLRAAGAGIGWGFQLQSPVFVTIMIYVLFAVALSLSGVFTFGDRLAGIGNGLASRGGYAGSFFTGALATLVATPCTAPFMATALGFALTQPWAMSLAVFEAVGVGLALPYLLLAFVPATRRLLPRPGAWMDRLKQFLAFPVYATAVWLVFVLSAESGTGGVTAALAGLVLIAFAAWLYETVRLGEGRLRPVALALAALAVMGALGLSTLSGRGMAAPAGGVAGADGLWQPFSQARLDALRGAGTPVFVDFTADWCITCKVNERIALDDPAVRRAFADRGVVALKGDWTRRDAEITRLLEANGRAGVPLYLFYPKTVPNGGPADPVVLPQILTADAVLHEVEGG
jgi:thiol:disulfide interchange protein DsbD